MVFPDNTLALRPIHMHIILKSHPAPHAGRLSLRAMYDQLPGDVKARRGCAGWKNTRVLVRDAIEDLIDDRGKHDLLFRKQDATAMLRAITSPRITLDRFTLTVDDQPVDLTATPSAAEIEPVRSIKLVSSKGAYFQIRPLHDAVPQDLRRYSNWSSTVGKINHTLQCVPVSGNCEPYTKKSYDAHVSVLNSVIACIVAHPRGFDIIIDKSDVEATDNSEIEREQTSEAPVEAAVDSEAATEAAVESEAPVEAAVESEAPIESDEGPSTSGTRTPPRDRVYHIDVTLKSPTTDREFKLQNREPDGWFRRSAIFKAWTSDYHAKKALDEVVRKQGFSVDDDVAAGEKSSGAWLSPKLARALAIKTGLSEEEVDRALSPTEDAETFVDQPTLEGQNGKLLERARQRRPLVTGHARACEFVKSLDGMILRAHGRFVDATLLLKSVGQKWKDFAFNQSTLEFLRALMQKRQVPISELIVFETGPIIIGGAKSPPVKKWLESHQNVQTSGIWVDFGVAIKLATWANPRFEVEVCDLVVRYVTSQVSADELDATRTLLSTFQAPAEGSPSTPSTAAINNGARARAALTPNTVLKTPWIPAEILKSPGGYVGSMGEGVVEEVPCVRLKAGEAQVVEKRWSASSGGHLSSAPHAQLLWAANPTNTRITGHDIQERTKACLSSDWCKQKGVRVISGTSNEEYWCPLVCAESVVQYVTRTVEIALGRDAVGCHCKWDASQRDATNDATNDSTNERLELTREETKRIIAHEEAMRDVEKHKVDGDVKKENHRIEILESLLEKKLITSDQFFEYLKGTRTA